MKLEGLFPFFRFFRIKILFWALLFVIGFFVFSAIKLLFFPILIGSLFALLLHPAVERLEGFNFSRVSSILMVFGVFLLLLTGTLSLLVPRLLDEIDSFQMHKTYYMEKALEKYQSLKKGVEKRYARAVPWKEIERAFHQPRFLSTKWLLNLPSFVGSSLELLLSFLLIPPLFAFFLLKDGPVLKKHMIHFVPNRYFELSMELLHNTNQQIIAFIRGQTLDSLINACLLATALSLIGLPYAVFVGLFGGVANAVPVLGPIVACSLALVIAFLTQSSNLLLVIAVFGVIHLLDVMFIYPKMVGHSLHLHEMVVILGVIVGGHFGGIVGMFLAVPLLGIVFHSTQIIYKTLKGYHIL